jgi:hypothetical protein
VSVDDLNAPLGTTKPKRRRFTIPALMPRAIAGVLAACVLIFALWAVLIDDPFGGEPVAIAPVQQRTPAAGKSEQPPTTQAKVTPPAPAGSAVPEKTTSPGAKTVTIIDGVSGKRQDVVVGEAPQSGAARTSIDERLIESSPQGTIPIMGPDGARAAGQGRARRPPRRDRGGRPRGERHRYG